MRYDHEDDQGFYEFANEQQAAFAVSQQTHDYGQVVIPAGMFAVVHCSIAYCRYTDATLPGTNKYVVRLAFSRRLAEYFVRRDAALKGDDYEGEAWLEVWPRDASAHNLGPSFQDDEIPF